MEEAAPLSPLFVAELRRRGVASRETEGMEDALRALVAENMGTGPKTDLLAISYSGVDYVGHRDGPDSPEIHDMVKRVDKLIGALIDAAEARAGQGNVLVAFTADHGATPVPGPTMTIGVSPVAGSAKSWARWI